MKKKVKVAKGNATVKRNRKALKIFLHVLIVLFCVLVATGGGVFWYYQYTKTHYEISFYQETTKKVNQNIRIAVIADIHNREYGIDNELLISDVRALKPDIILFAGDMVIRNDDDYQPVLNLISSLDSIAPCYGVLGNHESERIYFYDDKNLPSKLANAGLKLLRNEKETISIGDNIVQLIGVEGTAYGFEEYGGRDFMEKVYIDPSLYSIVMTHIPILFDHQLSKYEFDLGIAGHVHGGIVNLPYFGGLYSDEEGLFPQYFGGKYTLMKQQSLIISRGLGDSKAIPRINNMPELVIIDINCY